MYGRQFFWEVDRRCIFELYMMYPILGMVIPNDNDMAGASRFLVRCCGAPLPPLMCWPSDQITNQNYDMNNPCFCHGRDVGIITWHGINCRPHQEDTVETPIVQVLWEYYMRAAPFLMLLDQNKGCGGWERDRLYSTWRPSVAGPLPTLLFWCGVAGPLPHLMFSCGVAEPLPPLLFWCGVAGPNPPLLCPPRFLGPRRGILSGFQKCLIFQGKKM
jgi:hypothetical protein